VVSGILSRKRRAAAMQRTALVARGAAAGLCLAALAVLAADTRKGWARESYSNYSQFRYAGGGNNNNNKNPFCLFIHQIRVLATIGDFIYSQYRAVTTQVLGGGERDRVRVLGVPVRRAGRAHEEQAAFDLPSQAWPLRFHHGSGLCIMALLLPLFLGFFRVAFVL
jgi:hypothetical protein